MSNPLLRPLRSSKTALNPLHVFHLHDLLALRVAFVTVSLSLISPFLASANSVTWTGGTSIDFENSSNWGGAIPTNDLVTDIAVFNGAVTSNTPALSIDRSINGLNFQSAGWTLGGTGLTLTLGSGGITTAAVAGTNTISSNISLGAAQSWNAGLGNTLVLAGLVNGTNAVTVNGPGRINLTGSLGFSGAMNIASGTVSFAQQGRIGALGNNASITLNGGTLLMTGSNGIGTTANSGSIVINSGLMDTGNNGILEMTQGGPGRSAFVITGGTLNVGTFLDSGNALTFLGGVVNVWNRVSFYATTLSLGGGTSQFVMNLNGNGGAGSKFNGGVSILTNGVLNIDNSVYNNTNRLIDSGEANVSMISLKGGNLNFIGNSAANSSETYQSTAVAQGNSTITLTAGTNKSFVVTSGTSASLAGLTRTAGATVLFRGTNLGAYTQTTANSTNFIITNPTAIGLVGTNTTGSSVGNLAILPYAIGDASATGLGTGFVTYDSTRGIRLLASDEYASSVSAATTSGSSDVNVKLTSVDTLATSGTINSLLISSGTLNGAAVKLAAGALLATGSGNQVNSSTLDFGTREGIVTVNNDLLVSGTITGSGGLTKSGAGVLTLGGSNTYTGATTLNQGVLNIASATGLGSSSSIAFNGGNLQVSGATTSATTAAIISLNNVSTNNSITVDKGANLTLNGVISGSGALNVNGQGAITFGGSNTYRGGLNITSGTVFSNNLSALGQGNVSVVGATGTAFVQLQQSLVINPGYGLTIGGTTGAPGIVDTGTGTWALSAGTTTINSGGILQISSTWSNTVVYGNVVVNNGGTIQSVNNGANAPTDTIQGDVTLNSGATISTNLNLTNGLFGRLAIKGNFVANAGSTIADNFIGYIALQGTSAIINSGVTLKAATTGQGINEFTFVLNRGNGTTALTSAVALDTIFIRDQDSNSAGTNYTALISVSATGQNIGRIVYTNLDGSVTSSTATVKLGSDLTVIAGKGIINQSYGNSSTSPVALDLNGHTYDGSLASGNGAWSPNQAANGSTTTSPWFVTSSTGVGTFRAGSFNLTGTYTDVTIGSNVILEATTVGGTSDLGLKSGGTGIAKIDSTSTFAFNGAGSHTLKTTGTYANGSARSIGNLQVGNGSSISTLNLGSAITTGTGSIVSVNAGSTLNLQTYALNTNGEIQLNGGTVTGSNGSSFNIAGKVTASGTINSSISAPIALSGTQTVEVTNAATSLSIAGNISGATGGLTKTGAGSLFLNGNSSYSGLTEVSAGLLGVNGTLTADGGVNVKSGASLSGTGIVSGIVTNSGAIIGGLTFDNDVAINNGATAAAKAFNGNIANNGTITSDVTVQSGKTLSGNGTASGAVNVQSGNINGSGMNLGATKFDGQSALTGTTTAASYTVNSGATTASGVHTTTGNLAVNVGSTLTNTGSFSANIVSVASTATLTNNGTLNGTVNVSGLLNGTGTINGALTIKTDGELAPGNSPGITTVAGNLTVETGAKISMQIEGITAAGTDYDQIIVTGASSLVSLNAGSILSLSITDGVFTSGALTLIENQSDNAIVGTFSSVVIGGNTYDVSTTNKFTYGGKEYELFYNVDAGGDTKANDLQLAVVPEPSTWAMILGGMGSLVLFRRLRRFQTLG